MMVATNSKKPKLSIIEGGVKRPQDLSKDEANALAESIIANLKRGDQNPIEEALGVRCLTNLKGWSIRKIALELDTEEKGRSFVHNRLALLNMGKDVQAMITGRDDSIEAAKIINKLDEDIPLRAELIAKYGSGEYSKRDVQDAVNEWGRQRSIRLNGAWRTMGAVAEEFDADKIMREGPYGLEDAPTIPGGEKVDPGLALQAAVSHARAALDSIKCADSVVYRKRVTPHLRELKQIIKDIEAVEDIF